ncbi:RNA helicase [Bertholletia excelsa]
MGKVQTEGDGECSFIQQKGELGFIDYDDDKSVYTYDPDEEGPIFVSVPFPVLDGKPRSVLIGETVSEAISIKNTTKEPVELWKVDIYDSDPKDSFTISLMEPPSATSDVEYIQSFLEAFCLDERVLRPGETLTIWLSCKPKQIGLHKTAVHVVVGDDTIERLVFLLVEDKISQSLASNKPFRRERKKKQLLVDLSGMEEHQTSQTSSRLTKAPNQGFRHWLPSYPIPKEVRNLVEKKMTPDIVAQGLTRQNYFSYFSTLLIMEEIKLEENMRDYDMECVSFRKKGTFLTVEVPGLAERRPSLVNGDQVYAKLVSENVREATGPYKGHIYRVEAEEVHLRFDKVVHLHHNDGNLYNVQFTYNRNNMKKLYQATEEAESLETEFLFPGGTSRKRFIRAARLTPLSSFLNEEQKQSVRMILGCKGGPPYVIHGPPGTGKTVTLVEAVLQIYKWQNNTRVLVCAPSNSAADHLLESILNQKAVEIKEDEILRLNATTRALEDIKPDLLHFCYYEDSSFKCPLLRMLLRQRIIISTYMSAFLLYAEGIKRGHFSYIFLDEAGQASEPETMVPISQLCNRRTTVVLAGDPMQLGPVIHSKDAETLGLGTSYLERLFQCKYYEMGDGNYVTKLLRNYRCHPEILYLPSQLFYKGELIACKEDRGPSTAWIDLLPKPEFPVFFIGIQGCDEREGNNPSWFNRFEASKVVEVIKKLKEKGGLTGDDIGVITPYRQQVLKLSKALESLGYFEIKVGSVEQFQGQEREIIIISTVRSTVKHNDFDRIHCLGFLSNPKRFNVAITRARSLLIVIGNPHIIGKDPFWNQLLWHCVENSSYQGCPLPEKLDYLEEEQREENYPAEEGEYYPAEEGEYPQPSEEAEYQQETTNQAEDFPKPEYDETQWSDGWK